jgi:hypothetical protein
MSVEDVDVAQLLRVSLGTATEMLVEADGFAPFGLGVGTDGRVELVSVELEPGMEAEGLIEETEERLRRLGEAGLIRGAAVVTDVWLTDRLTGRRGSAIRIHLEHAGGRVVTCLVPYTPSPFAEEPDFGEAMYEEGDPVIFG